MDNTFNTTCVDRVEGKSQPMENAVHMIVERHTGELEKVIHNIRQ